MKNILLLADNEVQFREVWASVLVSAGYEVRQADTAEEARRILQEAGVDLAILDVRLIDDDDDKDISGLHLATEKAFRSVPKIMLTAFKISPENFRRTQDLTLEELPFAATWVGKDEGPDALLEAVRDTLSAWPNLRMLTSKVSRQIKVDHEIARQQARINYTMAVFVSALGFLLVVAGILLVWLARLDVGLVGTTSGIILQVLGYLFFTRLDLANKRMDIYHKELLQTYWLELLLATSEQLPFERQISSVEQVIGAALQSWFLSSEKAETALIRPEG